LLLTALVFTSVLPLIPGIAFHGNFVGALVLAFFFGIFLWLVDLLAMTVSAMLTVGSLGLALLILVPLWIFGFWLLPAVALRLSADFFPNYLTITGWLPAILGGLIMLFIGVLTSSFKKLFDHS
jgi:hypothetical protein